MNTLNLSYPNSKGKNMHVRCKRILTLCVWSRCISHLPSAILHFTFPFIFYTLYLIPLYLYTSISISAQDFEVGPAKLLYDCEPGQIQEKILYVRNHANQKQQFNLIAVDMPVDSAGKKKKVANTQRSCKDWLTVNPSFFDLNPNEVKEVKVVMQAPPGHSETRWCMLYVTATEEQTSLAADKQMRTGIKVKPRIGVRVIQSPKSNTNYKGNIQGLKEITQVKDTLRTFQVKVSNTGDKVIEGKIYLVLSNLETAKEIKESPMRLSILPGGMKLVELKIPKNVPSGKYSLAAILDYGNNAPLEAVQMNIEVK